MALSREEFKALVRSQADYMGDGLSVIKAEGFELTDEFRLKMIALMELTSGMLRLETEGYWEGFEIFVKRYPEEAMCPELRAYLTHANTKVM